MSTTTTLSAIKQTGDVPAKLTYLEWHDHYETEEPHLVLTTPDDPPDAYAGNVTFKEGDEEIIHDVRGHEDEFTLDKQGTRHLEPISTSCRKNEPGLGDNLTIASNIGFMFTKAPTSLSPSDFLDDETVKKKYLPECEIYFREYFKDMDEVLFIHYRVKVSQYC